eukprot:scaffold774_cov75-Cylindrotheca_fusiformis.AAC.4
MSATITFRMLLFRNRSTTTSITSSSKTVCRKFSSPAVAQATTSTMSMSSSMPSMSSSSSLKLPTRHSWKKPPPICHDWMELQEMTTTILQQPIGSLYSYQPESTDTNNTNNNNRLIWAAQERWKSYEIADPTIQQVEYLIRGHASKIPGSLYYSNSGYTAAGATTAAGTTATAAEEQEHHHHYHHLESMQQLLKRMQQEGMMYMQVRKEQQKLQRARNNSSSSESDSSDSDSDSDSSSSDSSDSSDDEENNNNNNKTTALEDFAPPGATIAMYDAILDAMAVSLSAPAPDGKNDNNNTNDPLDFLHWSLQALTMEEQDAELVSLLFSSNTTSHRRRLRRHASDQYSMATHVTYNAALRGIAQGIIKNNSQQQQEYCDNALYAAFQLYNHLTHSNHLPRNTASIIYMCQIVHHALLPESGSRVKGNISVTFWKQACQLGLASTELANTILQMHTTTDNNNNNSSSSSCGPEFDVFLKQLKTPLDQLPQRYRRSVKKNQHSKHY